jgi:hypothetical protein
MHVYYSFGNKLLCIFMADYVSVMYCHLVTDVEWLKSLIC